MFTQAQRDWLKARGFVDEIDGVQLDSHTMASDGELEHVCIVAADGRFYAMQSATKVFADSPAAALVELLLEQRRQLAEREVCLCSDGPACSANIRRLPDLHDRIIRGQS